MKTTPVITPRDVLEMAAGRRTVTTGDIRRLLPVNKNLAGELLATTLQGLLDEAPTATERDLMREFRFSLPEARAAARMLQNKEITLHA